MLNAGKHVAVWSQIRKIATIGLLPIGLKELRHRQRILKKIDNFFKFVGRNQSFSLRQLKPSLVIFVFLLFRWCFSKLENFYYEGSFIFEVNRKMTKSIVTLLL